MVVTATDAYTGLPIRAPGSAGSGAMSGIAKRPQYDPSKMSGNIKPTTINPAAMGGVRPPAIDPSAMGGTRPAAVDPSKIGGYRIDSPAHIPFVGSTGIRDPFATGGYGSFGYNPLPSGAALIQEDIARSQRDPVTGLLLTAPGGVQGASSSTGSAPVADPRSTLPLWMQNNYYDSTAMGETFDPSEVTTNSLGQTVVIETGEVIDPSTVIGGDPLAENEIVTETKIDESGGAGAAGDVTGFSESAQSKFDEFRLSGTIDTQRFHEWQLTLLGQQLYITDVREVPPNSGQFIAFDSDGGTHSSGSMFMGSEDVLTGEIAIQRVENETARLALDDEMQREQLRIQEELGRIDQDIARDRIRHDQEIAAGNWQNALDVQDRIDERERAGRQLDRDLFNASQELQNRKFELERASFDLDKMEFFQQLSSSPANFADLFNISRGLAPTGAGGPMPQGISRIGQSDVQQTAAQDFRSTGINMAPNINTGALPTLGAEQAVPQFNPAQTQLSFMGGGDPTPVDSSGVPIPSTVPPDANPRPIEEAGYTEDGYTEDGISEPPPASLQPDMLPPAPISSITAPVTGSNVDGLQIISDQNAVAQTAEEVVQGAPLPPGIEMAFRNALIGAPQTAQNSIPLLSPQVLNSLTPAEQEVYYGLAQMQGQYLPDLQNLLAARGGSQQIQDSQRVFA